MPRLTEKTRQERREAITAAAMRCFLRNGFAATSMADIIAEAGSSAGSIYSHFATKAELVRFTAAGALRDLIGPLGSALPAHPGPAAVLSHLLRVGNDRAHARTLLQIWAEAPRDPALQDTVQESLLALRTGLRSALAPWWLRSHGVSPDSDLTDLTEAVLTALEGYVVRLAIDPDADAELLARGILRMFAALEAEPGGTAPTPAAADAVEVAVTSGGEPERDLAERGEER